MSISELFRRFEEGPGDEDTESGDGSTKMKENTMIVLDESEVLKLMEQTQQPRVSFQDVEGNNYDLPNKSYNSGRYNNMDQGAPIDKMSAVA